ncbi:MAG: transposase [Candidatus Sulfotelmatobacter sp.]
MILAMLCWILIVGGLLIMMGQHDRSEALFYYFRLEDQVPENHLLRLIDRHISFEFVRQKLRASYSETGPPSIDPELLLRILLIGYLYGITSERKLVEELRMHLAWRWFTGLGSGGPEPQATGAPPQSADNPSPAGHYLVERRQENRRHCSQMKSRSVEGTFSTPTIDYAH